MGPGLSFIVLHRPMEDSEGVAFVVVFGVVAFGDHGPDNGVLAGGSSSAGCLLDGRYPDTDAGNAVPFGGSR